MISLILRYKVVILLSAILLVVGAMAAKVTFFIDKQEASQRHIDDLAKKDMDAMRALIGKK